MCDGADQGEPRRNFLLGLPDGPEGTRATLEIMRRLVRQWRLNPELRKLAENIVAGVPEKDFHGEANALFLFVRDKIRYVQDATDAEILKAPDVLIETGQGDCDDKSVLLAALLESLGHPARFVAIGMDGPEDFTHVYVETKIGSDWISLDPTEPVDMGWSPFDGPEPIRARMRWRI